MLIGRYFVIVPMMAVAGSLVAKKIVPASTGTFPTHGGLFVGLAGRRHPHRRRSHLLPGARAWADRRALRHDGRVNCSNRTHFGVTSMETSRLRKRMPVTALTDPKIVLAGDRLGLRQARSARHDEEPGDVRGRGRCAALTTVIFIREWISGGEHLGFTFQIILWLWITVLFANFAEAVAEGRGKAQAASLRQTREETKAKLIVDDEDGLMVPTPAGELAAGTGGSGRSRRPDPLRRRGDRGRRLGQRGGHHRRVGAGHSRVRRRPLGRHRRHAGGLRLAQGAHHRRARLDLPRPHDQAGRGRRAPEDAERDRAQHPARRHDHHLRLRHGDDPELCRLRRRHDLRSWSSWRCS